MVQNIDLNTMFLKLLTDFGLPTALCLYLLFSFKKSIDKLATVISKLTGVVLAISHTYPRGEVTVKGEELDELHDK